MPEQADGPAADAPKPAKPAEPFNVEAAMAGDLDFVDPADIAKPAPPPPAPAPTPAPARLAKADRRSGGGKVLVWAGAALVIALAVGGAIVFRGQIVRIFPASQAAYAGVGLPVSALGLAIEAVAVRPTFDGGHPALAVTGQVRNEQAATATSPALRVSLLDRAGKPLAVKVATPLDPRVPGHKTRHFAITIQDPPAGVHDLEVTFERAAAEKEAHGPPAQHVPVAPTSPIPEEAKPLPAGTPDALPTHG